MFVACFCDAASVANCAIPLAFRKMPPPHPVYNYSFFFRNGKGGSARYPLFLNEAGGLLVRNLSWLWGSYLGCFGSGTYMRCGESLIAPQERRNIKLFATACYQVTKLFSVTYPFAILAGKPSGDNSEL